jgi:hypothetical protein
MRELLHLLPESNMCVLTLLIQMLRIISKSSDVNKMTPINLSIVFGPNLLRSATLTAADMIRDTPKCNGCVCGLITYGHLLFIGIEE